MSLLITEATLDDVMRCALEHLLDRGDQVSPSKGDCRELRGVILEITNPRARLSRSESRGHAFSCLGELCWYLSGNNKLEFIEYYIPKIQRFCRTWDSLWSLRSTFTENERRNEPVGKHCFAFKTQTIIAASRRSII